MALVEFIIGAAAVFFVAAVHFLEVVHLMEWLKNHFPKLYAGLTSKALVLVLLVVGIGLMFEGIREFRARHEGQATTAPAPTGNASAFGDCNAANSGNGSKAQANCGEKPSGDNRK